MKTKNREPIDWYTITFSEKLKHLLLLRQNASSEDSTKIDWTINIITSLLGRNPFEEARESGFDECFVHESTEFIELEPFTPFIAPLATDEKIILKSKYNSYPNFTEDEYFDLIHDFFKDTTDKELFSLFRSMYKKRSKLIHQNMSRNILPESIFLPYFNEVHIRLRRENNISDLTNGVHEYGHGIQYLTDFHPNFFDKNFVFSEVVSTFFELLSIDYFKGIKDLSEAAHCQQIAIFNRIQELCVFIMFELEVLELNENFEMAEDLETRLAIEEELKEINVSLMDVYGIDIKDLFDMNLSYKFVYVLSYLIAVEIFMMYKIDREYALYILKEFMKIDLRLPTKQYFEEIKKLGIFPTENMRDYKKHIITPKTIFK